MPTNTTRSRPAALAPRAVALALIGLLCAIVAYWVMQLTAPRAPIAPPGTVLDQHTPDLKLAGQLFGLTPKDAATTAVAASNIQVIGVAASSQLEAPSAAILVVEGKAARAYAPGDKVADGVKLVAVEPGTVVIERNGARLELPAPARADVGVLTSGVGKPRAADSATASPAPASPVQSGAANPAPRPGAAAAAGPALGTMPAQQPGKPAMPSPSAAHLSQPAGAMTADALPAPQR